MKKKSRLIIGASMLIFTLALILGFIYQNELPTMLATILYGDGGGLLNIAIAGGAGAAIVSGDGATHQTVEAASTNDPIHEDDLDRLIQQIKPTSAVIDQILRGMGQTRKSSGIKTGGWEIGTREIMDKVTTATTAVKVATSSNSSMGARTVDIVVDNIQMWTKNNTFFCHGIAGGNAYALTFFVYDINYATNKLSCFVLNPTAEVVSTDTVKIPIIAADTVLQRLGTAMNELDAQGMAFSMIPSSRTNYNQIFMTQVQEGVIESLQTKKVDVDFSLYKAQQLWDFRREMESAFLFGVKSQFTHPSTQKTMYTCDGIWNQVTKNYQMPATITDNHYIEMTEFIFADQNGSDTKIMLAGSTLIADMLKSLKYSKQLESQRVEMKYGIKFNVIETNFGELYIRKHELFKGDMSDHGIVIDPSFIVKEQFEKLQTKKLDLDDSGQSRVKAERIHETTCPFVANLPTHCKISRVADPVAAGGDAGAGGA